MKWLESQLFARKGLGIGIDIHKQYMISLDFCRLSSHSVFKIRNARHGIDIILPTDYIVHSP